MTDEEQEKPKKARPRHHRAGAGMTLRLVAAAFLLLLTGLILTDRGVPLPQVARDRLVEAVNDRLSDLRISVEHVDVSLGQLARPKVALEGVTLLGPGGVTLADLNRIDLALSSGGMLRGKLVLEQVSLLGAEVTVRRQSNGSFELAPYETTEEGTLLSVADILAAVDLALDSGPLAEIEEVFAQDVVITLEDARSDRVWQATNAQLVLRERTGGLTLSVASDVFNGTDALAEVQVSVAFDEASRETELGIRMEEMPSTDIALQSPALAWLSVLRSPISGAVRAQLAGNGTLSSLNGTLDLNGGVLQPDGEVAPIPFEAARAYFSFDPSRGRIDFDEIGVRSRDFSATASGYSYLAETPSAWTDTFIGQFEINEASVDTPDIFGAPVAIDAARVDLRLGLSPFRIEIAEAFATRADTQARATGEVTIRDGLWSVNVDSSTDSIEGALVKEFWPQRVAPKTRKWIFDNVKAGRLSDVSFGVRFLQGRKPDVALSFDYHDAVVRYLKEMPVVQDGSGRATIHNREFVIEVEEGWVEDAGGKRIGGAGSVFRVPNIRQKPPDGMLSLVAEGDLDSVLEVLDHAPLQVMERAGRSTDIATARARVQADVSLPLKKGLVYDEVDFDVRATASAVESSELVPGRTLQAEMLALKATPEALSINGAGALDGVPFGTTWEVSLGADRNGGSNARGNVVLSTETLKAFGVELPPGSLRGESSADYTLSFAPDETAALVLSSDLRGLGMRLPALGWNKAPSVPGGFDFAMSLGETPDVTRFDFSAPGLAFSGDVDFASGGSVRQVRLSQLRVGQWLDATARITPRSGASPIVALEGGRLDLREVPRSSDQRQTGTGEVVSLNLDTVIVSDGIGLRPFRGQVTPVMGGLNGDFEARVGGQTLVRGNLVPAFGRTALRVEADDAGGVLRNANIIQSGRGGDFYLTMTPVSGAPAGTYDGEFRIDKMRLRDAPILAGLLNAISVVGLLDQLASGGLAFDTIDGAFRVTPDRIILRRMAAVGPSLGISAEGVYDPAAKELDLQGVISPIYFVNGIGALLTRRGEGLFGFSYRMTGSTRSPTVSVNPLSILTPGMFREIFRQPVPTE